MFGFCFVFCLAWCFVFPCYFVFVYLFCFNYTPCLLYYLGEHSKQEIPWVGYIMRLCQRQEVSISRPTLVLFLCHFNLISSSQKIILLSNILNPTSWRKRRKLIYNELYITQSSEYNWGGIFSKYHIKYLLEHYKLSTPWE